MAPKRSAESKLAAGPSTKRPKVANQVPSSPDSDNLEDYDWLKINAYLNGDSEEDQRYMMETNPFCQEGDDEELAAPSGSAAWGLPDGTPDLDALNAEFAAHPIEHFFEENAQTIALREVCGHPQNILPVEANSARWMDVLPPRPLEISQEHSGTPSSASHSQSIQMHLQQPQPITPTLTRSPCASGMPTSQTGQSNNQNLSQSVFEHAIQTSNALAEVAASQSTDETASQSADQQDNTADNQSADLPFACRHCDKRFKLERSRRRHIRDIHERQPHERRSFACPLCTRTYTRNDALLAHGRKEHRIELPHQPRLPRNTQGQ
ncbi:hypothetical protein BC567DRAFT_266628 [Phyllosticta citribraziliensis]